MDIFVKRPVLSVVISLILLLSGAYAYFKIPVLQFPQIESSNLVISTQYPGASAETVQGFITSPIERVAMTVPGVDFVDSKTTAGLSTVTVWLDLNEDSTDALAELTSRINQVSYELPEDALDPSVSVSRADTSAGLFYLNIKASEEWTRARTTDYMTRNVSPQLAAINGVQRIGLGGGRDPAMRVWLDPVRMASLGLGADVVLNALRNNNVIAAVGKTETKEKQINLLTNATLKTVEDFEKLVIVKRGDTLIRLGDVARVALGEDRGSADAKFNHDTIIYISIWPLPGSNAIDIGDEVYRRLEKINKTLPDGLEIEIAYDATIYMRNALNEIFSTLIETVVLVGLVVLLLMGSFRTALVPLITIPISILGTIAIISLLGFSLNLLTILAIVLSVGLVVDDAIVVVENVARHMREGMPRMQAALVSSRELLGPVIAMTVTLAAVYAPIGFVSGLTGALFKEFAFTLAIAVLISGVVAVTLSPVMSAYVNAAHGQEGRMTKKVNGYFDRLKNIYGRSLKTTFDWKSQTLFFAFFVSLLVIPFYMFSAKELAPAEDQGGVVLIIEGPPDSRVDYVNETMNAVVDSAKTIDNSKAVWQVLNPKGGFGGIEFEDYSKRDKTTHELRHDVYGLMSQIPGLRILPVLFPSLPTAGQFDVEMVVQGPDAYEEMSKYVYQLMAAGYESGQFLFLDTDLKFNEPQVRLKFDHDRVADLGLNINGVSQQLSAMVAEQEVNRFDARGKSYRVIPLIESEARHNPEKLLDLQLTTPGGELVPVRTIATLEKITGPQSLGTFNQQKSFRILGGLQAGATSESALATMEAAARKILPASYTIDHAGISRSLRKEGNSMFSVLLIAVCLVYLILVVQFNSFRAPLVVLIGSVPLALSGAVLFGFLEWTTINIYAQIGFITLVGLVAKNGILITEFANDLQEKGVNKLQAIMEACQVRLRPILMTAAATVIGHFPLVLVTGAGAEARNSIGIILVAGMVVGTVFTLYVLPCVYLLLGDEIASRTKEESMGVDTKMETV